MSKETPQQRRLRERREAKQRSRDRRSGKATRPAAKPSTNSLRIPGSRYYRNWCQFCGEAMRVDEEHVGKEVTCSDCTLKPQYGGTAATTDDSSPWQQNSIRSLEGD